MKLIALSFMFFSSVSFASVSGQWTGWGKWTYQGAGADCNPMTLSFLETNSKLIRKSGFFDCQVATMEVLAGEWTKEGDKLLDNGVVVGTISDKSIHLTENYSETVKVVSDINIDGNHFDYNETWYDQDMNVIYEVTGRFFKRQ